MPKFPIAAGTFRLPAQQPARWRGLTVTNTSPGQAATVTITEDATGRVIYSATLPGRGTATLSGLNLADLIAGGQYTVAVTGNVQGSIDTE